ncbi:MAG: response regulator transcription factor [Planctomycetes bacterium]|nr:response regulator transcription factor [Planctomycetota bacterium]
MTAGSTTPTDDPGSRGRILVVDDDASLAEMLGIVLRQEGFDSQVCARGDEALAAFHDYHPDLVLLDLMLPGLDGWEVCRRLRAFGDVPILILSAREEEEDRLLGLGLGADDYVVKPFSPREVVLRVHAILRRAGRPNAIDAPAGGPPPLLGSGPVRLDVERCTVLSYGSEVGLTPTEYTLLHALMRRPNKTFSRGELLDHLYPTGGRVVPKVIDVHIGRLRQKIEPEPQEPRHVITVRGFGYRFREAAS